MLSPLSNPGLPTVFDTFFLEELPVLVTELVEGKNLAQINELAPKPISEKRVLTWAAQLLDSLEYLHGQETPIIVRGLQPSNIILDRSGQLKTIDFGLAKSMDTSGGGTIGLVKGLGEDGFAPLEQGTYSKICLLYTSPSPRDQRGARMPSSA